MRLAPIALALPTLALAAERHYMDDVTDRFKAWYLGPQQPLKESVTSVAAKAKASAASAANAAYNALPSDPIGAAKNKVVDAAVTDLTLGNWKGVLTPDPTSRNPGKPDHWQIYLTGGNKTCYGVCGRADEAWKGAVPLLKVQSNAPRLAQVDCEAEPVLCASWGVAVPAVYTVFLPRPQPDQTKPHTPIYSTPLNRSSVRAQDIVNIHSKDAYKQRPEYTGYLHPFDSFLHQSGLIIPVAYALWGLSKMPTWLPMIAVSLGTRWFTSRRMAGQQARQGGAAAPAGGAPAAAPAPARAR